MIMQQTFLFPCNDQVVTWRPPYDLWPEMLPLDKISEGTFVIHHEIPTREPSTFSIR